MTGVARGTQLPSEEGVLTFDLFAMRGILSSHAKAKGHCEEDACDGIFCRYRS